MKSDPGDEGIRKQRRTKGGLRKSTQLHPKMSDELSSCSEKGWRIRPENKVKQA